MTKWNLSLIILVGFEWWIKNVFDPFSRGSIRLYIKWRCILCDVAVNWFYGVLLERSFKLYTKHAPGISALFEVDVGCSLMFHDPRQAWTWSASAHISTEALNGNRMQDPEDKYGHKCEDTWAHNRCPLCSRNTTEWWVIMCYSELK